MAFITRKSVNDPWSGLPVEWKGRQALAVMPSAGEGWFVWGDRVLEAYHQELAAHMKYPTEMRKCAESTGPDSVGRSYETDTRVSSMNACVGIEGGRLAAGLYNRGGNYVWSVRPAPGVTFGSLEPGPEPEVTAVLGAKAKLGGAAPAGVVVLGGTTKLVAEPGIGNVANDVAKHAGFTWLLRSVWVANRVIARVDKPVVTAESGQRIGGCIAERAQSALVNNVDDLPPIMKATNQCFRHELSGRTDSAASLTNAVLEALSGPQREALISGCGDCLTRRLEGKVWIVPK